MLEGAGAGWDDVARMTFYVKDPGESLGHAERAVGAQPSPTRRPRPSRYNMKVADDGSPVLISCDFIAYVEE